MIFCFPVINLHLLLLRSSPLSPRAAKQPKTHDGITPGAVGLSPAPSPPSTGAGAFGGFKPTFTPPPSGSGSARSTPLPFGAGGTPVTQVAVAPERKTVHQVWDEYQSMDNMVSWWLVICYPDVVTLLPLPPASRCNNCTHTMTSGASRCGAVHSLAMLALY